LAIDVASELRTLCAAQLRGTWQIPAEIVRLGLRLGAERVNAVSAGRGWEVRWSSPAIAPDTLEDLKRAFDEGATASERQRAIGALEESGAQALLWAAGLRGARLDVESWSAENGVAFSLRDGQQPLLRTRPPERNRPSVTVRWKCRGLDRRRSRSWLGMAVRFTDRKVTIDGKSAPKGFAGGLFQVRLDRPLPCSLGLTRSGDEPVLWLLNDGVVAARAGVPGYPSFEAAVEMSELVPPGASAADLRRAVNPHLTELLDRAAWMMLQAVVRGSDLSPSQSDRLMALVLRAACRGLRSEAVCESPFLPTVAGNSLTVNEIVARSRVRDGLVRAVEPSERATGTVVDPASTLMVSRETRAAFTDLTGLRFQMALRRRESRLSRFVDLLRDKGRSLGQRWRAFWTGPELEEDDLDPQERGLLMLLREELAPAELRLVEGDGEPARRRGALLLGRDSRFFVDGAKLVAIDPAWRCAVSLALGLGAGSRASRSELRKFFMRQ
jgi:hypothetical protein